MMWQLCNKLFGWHYAHVATQQTTLGIGRVRAAADGRLFVGFFDYLIFLDSPNGWTVTPLTWVASEGGSAGVEISFYRDL